MVFPSLYVGEQNAIAIPEILFLNICARLAQLSSMGTRMIVLIFRLKLHYLQISPISLLYPSCTNPPKSSQKTPSLKRNDKY